MERGWNLPAELTGSWGRLPHTSECRKRLLYGPWGVGTEVFWSKTVHVFCKHIGLLPFGCALLGES